MKSYRAVRRKRRCGHRKLLLVVLLTLTAGGAVAFAGFIKLTLEPNMEELAKIRAEVLVSRTVTRVLAEQYQKDTYKDELFTVTKDDEGRRLFGAGRSSPGKQIFIADRPAGRDHGHSFERICDGF